MERAYQEDSYAVKKLRDNFSYSTSLVKENQMLMEEKYMPKVMKDMAKHLGEKAPFLQPGQEGNFVITKSPKLIQQESQVEANKE
jgi:hypothetical protein